jgi:lipopolysaccharide export LptBFGC system permease protein LptF
MKISLEEYFEYFPESRRAEALKTAHDIRKFEIELYWKRATYFWTFIAAAFAGYFALQKEGDPVSVLVVSYLGFIFSLAGIL